MGMTSEKIQILPKTHELPCLSLTFESLLTHLGPVAVSCRGLPALSSSAEWVVWSLRLLCSGLCCCPGCRGLSLKALCPRVSSSRKAAKAQFQSSQALEERHRSKTHSPKMYLHGVHRLQPEGEKKKRKIEEARG